MIRKMFAVIILMFVGVLLLACDTQRDESSFRYVSIKVYDPVYIGYKQGIFENNGIKLEFLSTISGGPSAIQMVSGGHADGSLSSLMALNNGVNAGEKVLGVADIQSATEFEPLERFFIHKDKLPENYESFTPQEKANWLATKKISVNLIGSSFYYTWEYYFNEFGIDIDGITFTPLAFADQVLAIRNGAIDIASLMTPFNMQLAEDTNYVEILNALDVFGVKQFSTVFVNSELADENPELIKKFVNSLVETQEWIKDNQSEAKQIISEYTGVDAKYIIDYYFQENMAIIEDDVRFWLDYMGYEDIPTEKVATNRFNEKIGG